MHQLRPFNSQSVTVVRYFSSVVSTYCDDLWLEVSGGAETKTTSLVAFFRLKKTVTVTLFFVPCAYEQV